jgi:hypothetical protein
VKKTFRHNDFTAVFSDEGTGPENRYFSFTGEIGNGSGACGDHIVKVYPPFQILEDLHLASYPDGEPIYALENGFYHFKESGWDVKTLEQYWKVELTDDQKAKLSATPDKETTAWIMEEIRPLWAAKVAEARKLIASTPSDLTEIDETISLEDFDEPGKVRALAAWLDVHFSIIEEQNARYNEGYYTVEGITYQVLTDDEADEAQDQDLDSYLEECVFPDLPTNMVQYFDRDAWKEDAKMDGRGHSLGRYDGDKHEITDPESGEMFFAYR